MEKQKFNSQNYRDNLAKDLKDFRKSDLDEAQKILEEEKKTSRYKMAEGSHSKERTLVQKEYIDLKHKTNAFEEEFNKDYGNKELILKNLESMNEAEIIDPLLWEVNFENKRTRERFDGMGERSLDKWSTDPEKLENIKVHFVPNTENKVAFVEYVRKWSNSDGAKEYSKTHPEVSQINEGEYRVGGIKIKNEFDYKKAGYENGSKKSYLLGASIDEHDSKLPSKSAVKTTELDGTKMRVIFYDNTEISFDIKGILRNRRASLYSTKLFPNGFDSGANKFFSKSKEIY